MEQVPKIVSERLKAAAPALDHPDADILTAFSERTLNERERGTVLEHLSRCADCRDILALALPETEEVQRVLQPAPTGWFAWPTLRWGFAAAGIVIVASLGVLQYRKQHEASFIAQRSGPPVMAEQAREKKADAVPTPEPQPPALTASDSSPAVNKLKEETAKLDVKPVNRDEASPAPAPPAPSRILSFNQKTLPHGPAAANQMQLNANLQQQNSSALQQAQVQIPVAKKQLADQGARVTQSQPVEVAAGAAPVAADAERKLEVQSQSVEEQTLNGGQADSRVDTQNPAVIGYTAKARGAVRSPVAVASSVGLATQSTRWTINPAGGLERSVDQGKTWQDVDVSQSPPAPLSLTLAKNAPPVADNEAKDKIERSKSASIVFRAVSSNGSDVWAGGSSGLLYHSTDSGAHWTRVIPSSAGVALTGEVLTVSFIDPQHGKVSTSTSELWTTRDGGQTWDKQ